MKVISSTKLHICLGATIFPMMEIIVFWESLSTMMLSSCIRTIVLLAFRLDDVSATRIGHLLLVCLQAEGLPTIISTYITYGGGPIWNILKASVSFVKSQYLFFMMTKWTITINIKSYLLILCLVRSTWRVSFQKRILIFCIRFNCQILFRKGTFEWDLILLLLAHVAV